MSEFKPIVFPKLASDLKTVLWARGQFVKDDECVYPIDLHQAVASTTTFVIVRVMGLRPRML
jgi:hypothetical protein